MLMSSTDYRESLRRSRPRVYVNGQAVASVADEPLLAPGVNAIGLTYDLALREELRPVMRATLADGGAEVNRMLAIPKTSQDLLNNLFKYPYTKIEFIQRDLGVSRNTAIRYLEALVATDFLQKKKAGRDNFYLNEPLFSLLSGK